MVTQVNRMRNKKGQFVSDGRKSPKLTASGGVKKKKKAAKGTNKEQSKNTRAITNRKRRVCANEKSVKVVGRVNVGARSYGIIHLPKAKPRTSTTKKGGMMNKKKGGAKKKKARIYGPENRRKEYGPQNRKIKREGENYWD